MTSPRLCLPLEDWPAIDRARWLAAQEPAGFLEEVKPASKWSADSQIITEQGYGQWLAFLNRIQALDPSSTPGDRVTVDHLREFLADLQGRVAPVSVSIAVGVLLRMLRVLEPQRDWTVLDRVYRQLKRAAVPSRNKLAKMVPATDLLALGIRLMHTWADVRSQQVYKAAQFRDGLIAADLLGHADLRTTRKYYIQAVGMQAHARVQEVIAARRRAAAPGA